MTERSLARTVRRARAGDAGAFAQLYDEYASRVYAFVRSRTASAEDAEDVTATVFMKAWEALGSYEARGTPFSAWLFRIAHNAIVDDYRRRVRAPVLVDDVDVPEETESGPEEQAVIAADTELLRKLVRQLTDDQVGVIALRFWWGLSVAETATALGKNENAVKALQHRAIKRLARMLEEGDRDERCEAPHHT